MKKRILSALIALAMVFSVVPVSVPIVFATDDVKKTTMVSDVDYTYDANGNITSLTFTPSASDVDHDSDLYVMLVTDEDYDGGGTTDFGDMSTGIFDAVNDGGSAFTGQYGYIYTIDSGFGTDPITLTSGGVILNSNAAELNEEKGVFSSENLNTVFSTEWTTGQEIAMKIIFVSAGKSGWYQAESKTLTLDTASGSGGGGTDPVAITFTTGGFDAAYTYGDTRPTEDDLTVTCSEVTLEKSSVTWEGTTGATFPAAASSDDATITISIPTASQSSYKFDTSSLAAGTNLGGDWVVTGTPTETSVTIKKEITVNKAKITAVSLTGGDALSSSGSTGTNRPAWPTGGTATSSPTGATVTVGSQTWDPSATDGSAFTATDNNVLSVTITNTSDTNYEFADTVTVTGGGQTWTAGTPNNTTNTLTATYTVNVEDSTINATAATVSANAPGLDGTLPDFTIDSKTPSNANLTKTVAWVKDSDS